MKAIIIALGQIISGLSEAIKGISKGIKNAKTSNVANSKTDRNNDLLDGLSKRNANKR